jgi:inhibitor of cysteine peptidase
MFMKRTLKVIALALVVTAIIFTAGCAEKTNTQGNKTMTPKNEKVTLGNETMESDQIVTENDSGKTIRLKNGENFTLNLRENPTTGYAWELNLSKGLSILNDKYIQDPTPEGYTGVGGNHSWIIQAEASGSQQVKGIYRRSWENITGTEDKFILNLEIV